MSQTELPLIGFDAKRIVSNATGLGSYGRTLVSDLSRLPLRLRLYAPDGGHAELRDAVELVEGVTFAYPRHLFPIAGKALWRTRGIVGDLINDGVRLYHGLSGELPLGLKKSGIPGIVTIHDLIFMRHPEFYKAADRKIYEWKFRQTLRQAAHVIAISECTRRDILELGNISEERVSVIYQSCAPRFSPNVTPIEQSRVKTAYHLPDRYILHVGTVEPRKNIKLAVQAMEYLPKEVHLVIVGRNTPYTQEIIAYAGEHNLASRIHLLHHVPDADLPGIYSQAEVFVYPSRYEGFGIPIIEAIRSGLPVVACTGSCLEEAGGPDNLYVDADNVIACADALRQSLRGTAQRDKRISASRKYIERFGGTDVATQVYQIYQRFL